MRRVAQQRPQQRVGETRPDTVPSCVGGWNARDSLANMPATDAVQLDNWIVRTQGVQTRLGASNWTTSGLPAAPVESLMEYTGPTPKLFASASSNFYDVSGGGAVGAAVVTGLTNSRWQHQMFSNSAGQFLLCVNGSDSLRSFDGTSWSTVATLGAISTNTLNNIWTYKERLFFSRNGSLSFWYLPAGAISGATFTEFSLGQVCQRGGSLVAGATLSIDAGEGADDMMVLVTSEGEVIVYTGTDPGVAVDWSLVGVYFVGRPIGKRCFKKYGGDLLLLTDRGLFPISKALQSATIDRTIALTDKIDQVFADKSKILYGAFGWDIEVNSTDSFLLVNVPDEQATAQYIMDLVTGSWSRFLGWDAQCWAFFGGQLYYGGEGVVVRAYNGSSDFGNAIQCVMLTGYNYFGQRGKSKQVQLARPIFAATGPFSFNLAILPDFSRDIPAAVLTTAPFTEALWDVAIWDSSIWSADYVITKEWRTIPNWPFYNMALSLQLATASVIVQHIATDYKMLDALPNDL